IPEQQDKRGEDIQEIEVQPSVLNGAHSHRRSVERAPERERDAVENEIDGLCVNRGNASLDSGPAEPPEYVEQRRRERRRGGLHARSRDVGGARPRRLASHVLPSQKRPKTP